MRAHPRGDNAAIIGEVVAVHPGMLVARTAIGAQRVIAMQIGEQLQRSRFVQQLDDARFPCRRGVEAHQFDFWVGEWAVTLWQSDPSTAPVGHNSVTADLEHCAILEAWTPTAGGKGRSINFWDTNRHAWRQVWISAEGGTLDYEGHFADGAMRFTGWTLGADGKHVLQKLTFLQIAADTVRQLFEASEDGGTTWKSTFDGRYARLPGSARTSRAP